MFQCSCVYIFFLFIFEKNFREGNFCVMFFLGGEGVDALACCILRKFGGYVYARYHLRKICVCGYGYIRGYSLKIWIGLWVWIRMGNFISAASLPKRLAAASERGNIILFLIVSCIIAIHYRYFIVTLFHKTHIIVRFVFVL